MHQLRSILISLSTSVIEFMVAFSCLLVKNSAFKFQLKADVLINHICFADDPFVLAAADVPSVQLVKKA